MQIPKAKWIPKTMATFFKMVEEAEIKGDEQTSTLCFEVTDIWLYAPVREKLYRALDKLYSSRKHVELRLDCRDPDGNIWISAWEYSGKALNHVRKAMFWTTLEKCRSAGVMETPLEQGARVLEFEPLVPAKVDWVKGWTLEECYEDYDVSDDEDWVVL